MSKIKKIKPGMRFHSVHADSMAQWEVKHSRGADVWECEITPENVDYVGTRDVFDAANILKAMSIDAAFANMARDRMSFWENRVVGEVLHYHNGFGQYIRGLVVDMVDWDGRETKGLMPKALVGAWTDRDLQRWLESGRFMSGGYHVKQIQKGEPWQPSSTSIYECADFFGPRGEAAKIDPTVLEPIDLSEPEPTSRQAEAARLLSIIEDLRAALDGEMTAGPRPDDFIDEYRKRLVLAADIVEGMSLEEGPAMKP